MKQTLLTLCLIVFALPSWGQTTFSGGNISGGKISGDKITGDFHSQLHSDEVNGLIREYSIKPRRGTIDFDERDKFFNSVWHKKGLCEPSWKKKEYNASLEIIETQISKDGYGGSDDRIQPVSNHLLSLASACYSENIKVCNNGIEGLKKYLSLDAPKELKNISREQKIANDYIMNTSFISVVINFLSIYHEVVGLSDEELSEFDNWLINLTNRYRKNHNDNNEFSEQYGFIAEMRAANHHISSAVSSAALGAWLGEEELLDYGINQWVVTLRTMRDDGSLPWETSRGSKAIQYSGYTITKLLRLAEILRIQGVNLYEVELNGKTIHDNVSFYLDVLTNPQLIHKYAKADFASGGDIPYNEQEEAGQWSGHHAWIPLYILRFPNHPNSLRIKNFTGKENKHTRNLVKVVSRGYGGTYGLDLDSQCFYSFN